MEYLKAELERIDNSIEVNKGIVKEYEDSIKVHKDAVELFNKEDASKYLKLIEIFESTTIKLEGEAKIYENSIKGLKSLREDINNYTDEQKEALNNYLHKSSTEFMRDGE